MNDDDDVVPDPDCLDSWEGGQRPSGGSDTLPPLRHPRVQRLWWVQYNRYNVDSDGWAELTPMKANEARVYLEQRMQSLQILKRGRVHGMKDCWFDLPLVAALEKKKD